MVRDPKKDPLAQLIDAKTLGGEDLDPKQRQVRDAALANLKRQWKPAVDALYVMAGQALAEEIRARKVATGKRRTPPGQDGSAFFPEAQAFYLEVAGTQVEVTPERMDDLDVEQSLGRAEMVVVRSGKRRPLVYAFGQRAWRAVYGPNQEKVVDRTTFREILSELLA